MYLCNTEYRTLKYRFLVWENRYCIICASKDKLPRCFTLSHRSLAYSKVFVFSLLERIDIHEGKWD